MTGKSKKDQHSDEPVEVQQVAEDQQESAIPADPEQDTNEAS